MTEQSQTIEEMVTVYLKIRNAIAEMEERHKAELAVVREQFDLVAGKLLEICNEQNVEGIKTSAGTVSRRVVSRYWTSDWESMHNFIREHDALGLLEQRIHQGNMKQFLEENPDEYPMGLQADRKYTIQVRKPTTR
jgi:hypothetical protein